MRTEHLAFLKRARAARAEAAAKALRRHRGQAEATSALRLATHRLLQAELRRDRPRPARGEAGRFTTPAPAGEADLFGA